METHLAQSAGIWDSSQGAFISESHARLAAILHDYNPNFSLVWIPPKDRAADDTKPFAILDSSPGRPPYIMRYLSEFEMADPQAILVWVWEGDFNHHRPQDIFNRIEARERAEKLMKLKEQEDELQDRLEFGEYVFSDRSPHFMRHNGQTYRK